LTVFMYYILFKKTVNYIYIIFKINKKIKNLCVITP